MNALFNMLKHQGCSNMAHWPIRLTMAGIFVYHGAGKLMMPGMAKMMGLPESVWMLVGAIEALAGIGFVLGGIMNNDKITRLSGLALVPIMIVAIYMVHWPHWSFMVTEAAPMGGMEFQVLILSVALYSAFTGLKTSGE